MGWGFASLHRPADHRHGFGQGLRYRWAGYSMLASMAQRML
tara:strand:- start:308 stop:430 length:123 start_codon:yes stop_codon:yes gene_type:complete